MIINMRFDSTNGPHSKATIFVDGQNTGQLCMSPDHMDWFYLALERGCKAVSPQGMKPLEFIGTGSHRPGQPIPPLP